MKGPTFTSTCLWLPESIWAALTKYHKLGGGCGGLINNRHFVFSQFWSHSGKGSLPGCRWPTSHCVSHLCPLSHRELCGACLIKALSPFMGLRPHDLSTAPMPYHLLLLYWALGFQHMSGWEVQTLGP